VFSTFLFGKNSMTIADLDTNICLIACYSNQC
jgi:hypothetical protein